MKFMTPAMNAKEIATFFYGKGMTATADFFNDTTKINRSIIIDGDYLSAEFAKNMCDAIDQSGTLRREMQAECTTFINL